MDSHHLTQALYDAIGVHSRMKEAYGDEPIRWPMQSIPVGNSRVTGVDDDRSLELLYDSAVEEAARWLATAAKVLDVQEGRRAAATH